MRRVLLLSAGRRVSLAERFRARGFAVYAYETDRRVPISSVATVLPAIPWSDPDSGAHVRAVIQHLHPTVVLCLRDEALPVVAPLREEFPDQLAVPPVATATACYDKERFDELLHDAAYYPAFKVGQYPIIAKPRFGAGSRDLHILRTERDHIHWRAEVADPGAYVLQRFVTGREYTVDAMFSRSGALLDYLPRIRLRVAGGEVISSQTVEKPYFGILLTALGRLLPFAGPVCVQIIGQRDRYFIIEANARLGGGVILSMEAGLDVIGWLLAEYAGESPPPVVHDYNLLMHRTHREYFYPL